MGNHYEKDNLSTPVTVETVEILKITRDHLEMTKDALYTIKAHKSAVDALQTAIDKIALAHYHATVISKRFRKEEI